MFPASMRPATRLAIVLVLGQMATARAGDLSPEAARSFMDADSARRQPDRATSSPRQERP